MIKKNCLNCGKNFMVYPSDITNHNGRGGRFCSSECFHSQNKIWLNKKRPEHSLWLKNAYKSGRKTSVLLLEENNPAWKGNKAGYFAIHQWLYRKLGKAWKCLACNKLDAKKYEWASLSHKPKRDITDWTMLCTSCHRLYDYGKLEVPVWIQPA